MIIHFLDLVSVFAFAFFGAHAGIRQRFTFLGVLTCAFLPALGGGTIREILLNHTPVYFGNYAYGAMVLAATIFALSTRQYRLVTRYMYVLDALGMAIFADLGARAALHAHLGLSGAVVFAVLTACGGGILCDLVTNQVPHAFRYRLYTVPPIMLGFLLWLTNAKAGSRGEAMLIAGAFVLQFAITMQIRWPLPAKIARLHEVLMLQLAGPDRRLARLGARRQ